MMWDYEDKFSERQALTATAVSTNVIYLIPPTMDESKAVHDVGPGRPIYLQVLGGGFTGVGTLNIKVQVADDEAMTGAETIMTLPIPNDRLVNSPVITAAVLPMGCKAYIRIYYVVTGDVGANGWISAGLTLEPQVSH